MPFEDALRTLLLEPLGLGRTFFSPEDVMTHRFAVGHNRLGLVFRPWAVGRPLAPVGGLVASAAELLKYATLQWDPRVLSAESLADMRHPRVGTGVPGETVGLAWFLYSLSSHSFAWHSGGTGGQVSRLLVAPDDRFALAVLTNHDDGAAVCRDVQTAVLRDVLRIEPMEPAYHELPASALREYEGEYESAAGTATIKPAGGELLLDVVPRTGFPDSSSAPRPAAPGTRLRFIAPDVTVELDGPFAGGISDFIRDSDGQLVWYRLRRRLHRRTAMRAAGD
jgi:CubicO group peptidase (beta-lactamase class C family)